MEDDNEDFDIDKKEIIDYVRTSLDFNDDVSDYEIQELIDSGEVSIDFFTFDENVSNEFDKLMKEIEDGNDVDDEYKNAIIQKIYYLLNNGEKEELKTQNGINISNIKEKNFNDEDTNDIDPIDENEFKKMLGEDK